ncbi:type II toxin-antitoxin system VapC family toxin [candidate division KSB1 bacterium]|nr:type II toxin-antitoxin system VapC family toxin [candidate division KSB1 bacterium]
MVLVDTNIFLEILLNQEKREKCKNYLSENEKLSISDFSLHSIGVILYRNNRERLFSKFIADILPNINLLHLPQNQYHMINDVKSTTMLDFDDSYQLCVAKFYDLKIVTLDKDFADIENLNVEFL